MEVGIDIIDVNRFKNLVENQEFLNKHFSNYEINYIKSKGVNSVQTIAGLFACKEAILKAFGTGISKELSLLDCCIVHLDNGKPVVELNDKIVILMNKLNLTQIKVSISHTSSNAIAICNLL